MASVAGGPGRGVVAAGHPAVAAAGAAVLRRGGNAVDALVAAMFTSFHAEPILGGPGGAGFLVAEVGGQAAAWDFFSTAPGLGTGRQPYTPPEGAFTGVTCDYGETVQVFHVGPGSVAVPGAAQGLVQAQQEAGKLALWEVLEPAVEAYQHGTEITRMSHTVATLLRGIVDSTPEYQRFFTGDDGHLLPIGATFHNPDLVHLAEALARDGADALRGGDPARALVAEVARRGGGVTAADLLAYEVKRTQPVLGRMGDAELWMAPPPSSGGMLISYSAALLEGFETPAVGSTADVLLMRAVLCETQRARAEVIGDRTPTRGHAEQLLDGAYVEGGRARLRHLLSLGPQPLGHVVEPGLGSTTHVSVIDAAGDAAAATVSIGEASGLVVPGYGIFLNNFLGEEDLNPLGFHRFRPGARMGSSMCPMVVRRPDGSALAMGTGGANRIRTVLLQVARHVLVHHQPVDVAVAADRLHFEHGMLYAEGANQLAHTLDDLGGSGVQLTRFRAPSMFFGGVHVAGRATDGHVLGVGDDRRSGRVELA